MQWQAVIGLEVHVQLATRTKMFSGVSTAYGAEPNTQACAVSIALPGTLPVVNKEAIRLALKFGLGLNAEINQTSIFARKNYFYPDLPKGYQISQFELPIVGKGELTIEVDSQQKVIGITRAHLEEDAGKSLHEDFQGLSGIDLNRAGTPLLEIVSEPDMHSAKEAVAYLKKLHTLVRYLDVSDGNMQEGSFRFDANVSIRPMGETKLGTRSELKNINSFRFVEKAINYEIERQIDIKENGGEITQETRLYDADKNETRPMRGKEEAHDYRYFPDPDLPPLVVSEQLINQIKSQLPELPEQKKQRFIEQHQLEEREAELLTQDKDLANYFEAVCNQTNATTKTVANWILGSLLSTLNQTHLGIRDCPVTEQQFAILLNKIADNTLSGKLAKEVFQLTWESGKSVEAIIEEKGLKQITDLSEIEAIVEQVLTENEQQISQYKSGNTKVFGFFVGQIMKKSSGKANPQQVNELLRKKLD